MNTTPFVTTVTKACGAKVHVLDEELLARFQDDVVREFKDTRSGVEAVDKDTNARIDQMYAEYKKTRDALADLTKMVEWLANNPGTTLTDWHSYCRVTNRIDEAVKNAPDLGDIPF